MFVSGRNGGGIQQIFRGGVIGSINGNTYINGQGDNYGNVFSISGSSISGFSRGKEVKEASEFKVIALDSNGTALDSYRLPVGTALQIHITAPTIKEIHSTVGDVVVEQATKIGKVSTSTGKIQIQKAEKVGNVSTSTGQVTVVECQKVGAVDTTTGNIQVTKVRRDASPKRRQKK